MEQLQGGRGGLVTRRFTISRSSEAEQPPVKRKCVGSIPAARARLSYILVYGLSVNTTSKSVGERTEAIVLAELLKAGYVVLLPFGDNQRYDLVIDDGVRFQKVQCKTARLAATSAAITFRACSSYVHRGRGRKGYRGEADLFGVYSPDTGKVYIVPVDDVGETDVNLRLEPPLNGQARGIRMAEQYELKVHMVA